MADISITGADKFAAVARELKKVADKGLQKELSKGISRAVRPMTKSVKQAPATICPEVTRLNSRSP